MLTEDRDSITRADATWQTKTVLRKAFPGNKFTVTSRWSEINVRWTDDGPTVEQVQHALTTAKCAQLDERYGNPRYNGPGGRHYWFDRYNEAARVAEAAERERRHQEGEERRRREQAAVDAAYRAKCAAARAEAEPITAPKASDPAAFEVFEALRELAEVDVSISSEAERQRRPSWAPALIVEDELLDACRELGYLRADDKPIVRLWAQFADPKKKGTALREAHSRHPLAGIVCRGFQLHAGSERGPLASMLFEAQREQSGQWRFSSSFNTEPRLQYSYEWEQLIRARAKTSDPVTLERINRMIAEVEAKESKDAHAHLRRQQLRQRVGELAKARVLEFAGAPGLQMQAASRLWGCCFNCGKELSDPISLERGIGPDCLVNKVKHIRFLAPHLGRELPGRVPPTIVTLERIVFWTAMPLEFVKATIDEMPGKRFPEETFLSKLQSVS
jgi:Large polyvalent protein associated domain 29/Family of unknown function (DUF6011)